MHVSVPTYKVLNVIWERKAYSADKSTASIAVAHLKDGQGMFYFMLRAYLLLSVLDPSLSSPGNEEARSFIAEYLFR